jgi:hypothetical protein
MVHEIQQNGWTGLWHYYHFVAEDILGGFAALASSRAPRHESGVVGKGYHGPVEGGSMAVPDRIVIPWEGNWHDKWGMNEMVVNGVFDGSEWYIQLWGYLMVYRDDRD